MGIGQVSLRDWIIEHGKSIGKWIGFNERGAQTIPGRESARFTVQRVLPTPPLPEATAKMGQKGYLI